MTAFSMVAVMAAAAYGADDNPPAKDDAKPAADTGTAKKEDAKPASGQAEAKKDDAAAKDSSEGSTDYRNWITVSAGGAIVSGRTSEFQSQHQLPNGAFGGVEDFHYEQDVGKHGLFKVDGRGIFDNHDYGIKLELSNPDKGFVRLGYTQSRTWSDGGGGYFPGTGPGQSSQWVNLYDNALALDRTELTFEAGLRLPKVPQLTFRYTRQTREGSKDATTWGPVTQTGDLSVHNITPSFLGLDEVRNVFALDLKHTLGKTDVGLGFSYERLDNNDTRNDAFNPGQPGASYSTQREDTKSDMFSAHGYASTPLGKRALFSAGYAFTDLDATTTGYRVYGIGYDPDLAQRLPSPNSFDALSSSTHLDQHLINANVFWRPKDTVAIVPSLRIDKEDWSGSSAFGQPALPFTPGAYFAANDRGLLDVAGNLEVRYTGVTNWVFFARGTWRNASGNLNEHLDNTGTGAQVLLRATDDTSWEQKYVAGANWYPLRLLNFAVEYYHKIRDNNYTHTTDSTPNLPGALLVYPAFLTAQGYTTDDVNFRTSWRPRNNLSLVGRYDFQYTAFDSQAAGLAQVQAAQMTSHILSGTATWSPLNRLYLLAGLNYVWDRTDSPAVATTPALQNSRNDYWTANAGLGYALDDKTDFDAQYLFYRAHNFVDNSAFGLPYGAGDTDQGVTAAISRQINRRMRVTLRYGYYVNRDQTSGDHLDYTAHVIYSSLQYRF
jgi:hypothetical protein